MSTSMLKHLQMFLCLEKLECKNTNYCCSNTFVRLVYIHDGTAEGEIENRLRHLGEAALPELRGLTLMHEVNPYVQYF